MKETILETSKKYIFTLLILLAGFNLTAQVSPLISTLDSAKRLRNAGHFQEAVNVLEDYNRLNPDNIWVMQLLAETRYWMNDYEGADNVYRRAIRLYPDNFEVKYEYALFLFGRGAYSDARELLLLYVEKYPDVAGAESLLGIIDYYLGNFRESEQYLKNSLALNPGDQKTREIYTEVKHIVRPWVKASVDYSFDSQPMNLLKPVLSAGWYRSNFINLSLNVGFNHFTADTITSNMTGFGLKNSFLFPKAGFKADVSMGGIYTSIDGEMDVTWGINLDKTFLKHIHLKAGATRSPYTYTVASINKPFLRNTVNASVSYETTESWNADMGYIGDFFPDDNHVQTVYAWGLSPALKFSVFRLNVGYAFNYANSKESRYVSEKPLDEILDNFKPDEQIKGIYDPYFTPEEQFSNSVLANIYIVPSKAIDIKLHASVGFYARAMNPYLYLDRANGKTFINRDFYQESFTPMDIGVDFYGNLSDNLLLTFSYQYLQTFYFDSNNFNLALKIYF